MLRLGSRAHGRHANDGQILSFKLTEGENCQILSMLFPQTSFHFTERSGRHFSLQRNDGSFEVQGAVQHPGYEILRHSHLLYLSYTSLAYLSRSIWWLKGLLFRI